MTALARTVPVLAMPMLDPGAGRIERELPEGLTLAEIVSASVPMFRPSHWPRLRVTLVSPEGKMAVASPEHWSRLKPRAGVKVLIRVIPSGDTLKSVLLIAVSIAAVALGQLWAPALLGLGIPTAIGSALIGLGVTLLGTLLINALIPSRTAGGGSARETERPTYAISGWRNQANPDGPIPAPLGRHRMAPMFAAPSYTVISGDDQYVVALFVWGYGQLNISDLRLGDTPLAKYTEVTTQTYSGLPGDPAQTLYPQQVIENQLGVELLYNLPRASNGDIASGPPEIAPVSRFTAADVRDGAVIIAFPGGLVEYANDGTKLTLSVTIQIRQRPATGGPWSVVNTMTFSAKRSEAFFRQFTWSFPSRGRYEVELTRLTPERTTSQTTDRTVWASLQSMRPEYPINFDKPLALTAIRVKATHQLNSSLDTLNGMVARVMPDWDYLTGTWVNRETRNPASLFRFVLQGNPNTFPTPDTGIDLAQLADWHNFCRLKGLKYDRLHDFSSSLEVTLGDIAAAGRASPRHDGRKWGVVIDRPRDLVIDHITPRNSRNFSWSRTYFKPPHALRVPFLDATNDYASAERIIPWPGQAGDITVTEQLELPGKTDPDEIFREARRRQYEIIYRPDRFTAVQDGAVRAATRGDLVMGSFDTLERTQVALRVVAIQGNILELDGTVEMIAGQNYACRYRKLHADGSMESLLRSVVSQPGIRSAIRLTGFGDLPAKGEVIAFGIAGQETMPLIVGGIEAGEELSGMLTMLPAAPIIDQLTDAEVPPAWNGRVGAAVDADTTAPVPPTFFSVEPRATGFEILLRPGSGGAVIVARYNVRHRLSGTSPWTIVSAAEGGGGVTIDGYLAGDLVELEAQAVSPAGVGSLWTDPPIEASVPIPPEGPPEE